MGNNIVTLIDASVSIILAHIHLPSFCSLRTIHALGVNAHCIGLMIHLLINAYEYLLVYAD